jgi:hypothetical protein
VTARRIEEGLLSDPNVNNVSTSGGSLGVDGDTGGPAVQLGYDPRTNLSEELIIALDDPATSATVDVHRLFANEGEGGEVGHWQAYSDGSLVGEGTIVAPSGHTVTVVIEPD